MKFPESARVLRYAIKQANVTQGEISRRLGFTSQQYISNCVRGLAAIATKHYEVLEKMIGLQRERLIRAWANDMQMNIRKEVERRRKLK